MVVPDPGSILLTVLAQQKTNMKAAYGRIVDVDIAAKVPV